MGSFSDVAAFLFANLVVDFLRGSGLGFTEIQRTSTFDKNDKNGIDAVGKMPGEVALAIDITFNGGEKLKEKRERNLRQPCVCLHSEAGLAISEPLPRILIHDISQVNWMTYAREAQSHGIELIDAMGKPNRIKKERQFLNQILTQINGLSRFSSDYKERIKPAKEIFQKRLAEIGK